MASSCSRHRGAFSHTTYSGYDPTLQKFWPPKCKKNRMLSASNSWPSHHHRHSSQVFHAIAQEIQLLDLLKLDGHDNDDEESKKSIAAVVFTGEGSSFCAGADLSDPPNPLHQSSDLPHHLKLNPVYQMSKDGAPIIGALRGHVSSILNWNSVA